MSDLDPAQHFAAAKNPAASTSPVPALTAKEKLHLLSIFPSVCEEEAFPRAAFIMEQINNIPASEHLSGLRTLLDYAVALRKETIANPKSQTAKWDIELSSDIFKNVIHFIAKGGQLENDIFGQPLCEAFTVFVDVALRSAPHAYYLDVTYEMLDINPYVLEFLNDEGLFSADTVSNLQLLHADHAAFLDIDHATITATSEEEAKTSAGVAGMRNVRQEGLTVLADHKLRISRLATRMDTLKTLIHETDHIYQNNASLAGDTYHAMRDELLSNGLSEEEAEEFLRKSAQKTDLPFLAKMMCTSEEYRFFAEYMNFSHAVYPRDPGTQMDEYLSNPKEQQAFDVEHCIEKYLSASPLEQADMRTQTRNILLINRYIEEERRNLKTALLKEIADAAGIKSAPHVADTNDARPA